MAGSISLCFIFVFQTRNVFFLRTAEGNWNIEGQFVCSSVGSVSRPRVRHLSLSLFVIWRGMLCGGCKYTFYVQYQSFAARELQVMVPAFVRIPARMSHVAH